MLVLFPKILKNKGVHNMYKSYPWPGASSLKSEVKLIVEQFKELLNGVLKDIKKDK